MADDSAGALDAWFGTPDAPAPSGPEETAAPEITVGVTPALPGVVVAVRYRRIGSPWQRLLLHESPSSATQMYFTGRFPALPPGTSVEYEVYVRREGASPAAERRVGSRASFRIAGTAGVGATGYTPPEPAKGAAPGIGESAASFPPPDMAGRATGRPAAQGQPPPPGGPARPAAGSPRRHARSREHHTRTTVEPAPTRRGVFATCGTRCRNHRRREPAGHRLHDFWYRHESRECRGGRALRAAGGQERRLRRPARGHHN